MLAKGDRERNGKCKLYHDKSRVVSRSKRGERDKETKQEGESRKKIKLQVNAGLDEIKTSRGQPSTQAGNVNISVIIHAVP